MNIDLFANCFSQKMSFLFFVVICFGNHNILTFVQPELFIYYFGDDAFVVNSEESLQNSKLQACSSICLPYILKL